jgi:Holliday junction resolvase RusA-like endonuclease
MPKKRMKLEVRIGDYLTTRRPPQPGKRDMTWRRKLHQSIVARAREHGIKYFEGEELEVDIVVYGERLGLNDVDNLAKHVLDALQGRLGGSKALPQRSPVVPNDAQIKRLTIEKRARTTAKQASKLIVRDFARVARAKS